MKRLFSALLFCLACLAPLHLPAATSTAADAAQAQRARQLLEKAVAYYRQEGDKAFAAFSRQGEFIDNELYVYVVDSKGVMLASGGPSVVLIGRDVSQLLDPNMRKQFAKALKAPENGKVQETEYRWKNWADGRVERKHTYYQRIGDRFLAVGYYIPRADARQAEAMLQKTAKAVEGAPEATFKRINDLDKAFIEDDLYAFVVDMDTGKFVAHGYNTRMVGTDFASLKDPAGNAIGQAMLALAKSKGEGQFDYQWRNPVTGKVENKHALLRKSGHYLVAVGYYTAGG
ncbi:MULTISPECIES: cache domain-containing protein [Pseudomonas]|uniref:Calcium channel protein n=1 Tax=Pseudomonas citronellolis TaxID=53408 RepID=A0A1A9KA34_9PSED|nr:MULTISPECIES: cache domain-containing protein [Pseudomonas]ANI14402.1 calcium channel protein [Pseudomonas citronellolis]MBB1609728.1 calcium channel protein [Pseudomonas sp. UMC76]MBB1638067.1 calcium channel protein [Pseudomonas sp. UME83]NTX92275.1 calcium channel protein [Pseudomonas sp. UMA643]NTY21544.1 calcium channel protein [Pseudomonas sp. UMC3103]